MGRRSRAKLRFSREPTAGPGGTYLLSGSGRTVIKVDPPLIEGAGWWIACGVVRVNLALSMAGDRREKTKV